MNMEPGKKTIEFLKVIWTWNFECLPSILWGVGFQAKCLKPASHRTNFDYHVLCSHTFFLSVWFAWLFDCSWDLTVRGLWSCIDFQIFSTKSPLFLLPLQGPWPIVMISVISLNVESLWTSQQWSGIRCQVTPSLTPFAMCRWHGIHPSKAAVESG